MIKHLSNTKRSYSVFERSQFTGTSENRQNFFFVRFSGTQLSKEVTSFSRFENWFLLSFVMMWKWEMSMSIKMLERHKDHSTMYVWNTDSLRRTLAALTGKKLIFHSQKCVVNTIIIESLHWILGFILGSKWKLTPWEWYASVVFIWSGDMRNQLNFL